jgi:hypothetical protein
MPSKGDTVRYSAVEIKAMIARGEDRTDWAKVYAISGAELEASIDVDPDDVHAPLDWNQAAKGLPPQPRIL